MGLSMQAAGWVMEKAFGDAVIACVGYFIPEVLFSGEGQIHAILADPARFEAGTT